jgi:hypothetical protein
MELAERRALLPIALAFGAVALLVQLLTNGQYGYFRDELYYLACGDHLDWGYADHAPLIALIAKISRGWLGGSLRAIRFAPALAGAAVVLLTGLLARQLGGGSFAIALACLSALVSPGFLRMAGFLSMNAFEPLFWMGFALVAVLVIDREQPKLWLWAGVLAGLGLENKHSMLFFGAALVAGLLLTPERRLLANRWIWFAGAIALLIWLPNLIWEQRNNWATLELLENVRKTHKNVELGPLEFMAQQLLLLGPVSALVWIAGLAYFLCGAPLRKYRALGWAYLIVAAMMIVMHGKIYYLQPAYPMLFAAGGVFWEHWTAVRRRWVRVALPVVVALAGAALAPIVLPILPVESFLRYEDTIGIHPPKQEIAHSGPLPQYFGDMFGWPEMVETVARVYRSLPADQRTVATIFATNYGEAAAIDFFGPRYGLPKAVCPHQSYWLWGPRDAGSDVVIVLQWPRERAERMCGSLEEAAMIAHPYSMAEEHGPVFICRGLKPTLQELWPRIKHWN